MAVQISIEAVRLRVKLDIKSSERFSADVTIEAKVEGIQNWTELNTLLYEGDRYEDDDMCERVVERAKVWLKQNIDARLAEIATVVNV